MNFDHLYFCLKSKLKKMSFIVSGTTDPAPKCEGDFDNSHFNMSSVSERVDVDTGGRKTMDQEFGGLWGLGSNLATQRLYSVYTEYIGKKGGENEV